MSFWAGLMQGWQQADKEIRADAADEENQRRYDAQVADRLQARNDMLDQRAYDRSQDTLARERQDRQDQMAADEIAFQNRLTVARLTGSPVGVSPSTTSGVGGGGNAANTLKFTEREGADAILQIQKDEEVGLRYDLRGGADDEATFVSDFYRDIAKDGQAAAALVAAMDDINERTNLKLTLRDMEDYFKVVGVSDAVGGEALAQLRKDIEDGVLNPEATEVVRDLMLAHAAFRPPTTSVARTNKPVRDVEDQARIVQNFEGLVTARVRDAYLADPKNDTYKAMFSALNGGAPAPGANVGEKASYEEQMAAAVSKFGMDAWGSLDINRNNPHWQQYDALVFGDEQKQEQNRVDSIRPRARGTSVYESMEEASRDTTSPAIEIVDPMTGEVLRLDNPNFEVESVNEVPTQDTEGGVVPSGTGSPVSLVGDVSTDPAVDEIVDVGVDAVLNAEEGQKRNPDVFNDPLIDSVTQEQEGLDDKLYSLQEALQDPTVARGVLQRLEEQRAALVTSIENLSESVVMSAPLGEPQIGSRDPLSAMSANEEFEIEKGDIEFEIEQVDKQIEKISSLIQERLPDTPPPGFEEKPTLMEIWTELKALRDTQEGDDRIPLNHMMNSVTAANSGLNEDMTIEDAMGILEEAKEMVGIREENKGRNFPDTPPPAAPTLEGIWNELKALRDTQEGRNRVPLNHMMNSITAANSGLNDDMTLEDAIALLGEAKEMVGIREQNEGLNLPDTPPPSEPTTFKSIWNELKAIRDAHEGRDRIPFNHLMNRITGADSNLNALTLEDAIALLEEAKEMANKE